MVIESILKYPVDKNIISNFSCFQKPLMLHGHERSITQIKYNRDGDLLFSSAKDNHPCVWYSINGERLGTYEGHQGVVWAIDVDWETKRFMSGAGDNMLMIWDVQTGIIICPSFTCSQAIS